jgi:hypothetical protein
MVATGHLAHDPRGTVGLPSHICGMMVMARERSCAMKSGRVNRNDREKVGGVRNLLDLRRRSGDRRSASLPIASPALWGFPRS